ncbi:hypothetical protein COSO111634_37930 [Corallococcus soli]
MYSVALDSRPSFVSASTSAPVRTKGSVPPWRLICAGRGLSVGSSSAGRFPESFCRQ